MIKASQLGALSLAVIDEIVVKSKPCPPRKVGKSFHCEIIFTPKAFVSATTTPAPTTTSTTTTTTTPVPETEPNYSDAVCPAVLCNFEEGDRPKFYMKCAFNMNTFLSIQGTSCNFYNSPNGGAKSKKWKVVNGTFHNRITGVLSPGTRLVS